MPVDYSKYPADWKKISLRIRERSGGQCECMGECGLHRTTGGPRRCCERNGEPAKWAKGKIILTVAHLDHDTTHNDDSNLKAMCQRCHNRYDQPFRKMNRFRNRIHGDIEARIVSNRGEFSDLDSCWEWVGCKGVHGYGRVRIDGVTGYVHRFMMEWILKRKLKRLEHVDHICRNRACFRPSHLELVTPSENTQRGLVTKISSEKIVLIRELRKRGHGVVELGALFKVHHTHISRICNNLRRVDHHKNNSAKTREAKKWQNQQPLALK